MICIGAKEPAVLRPEKDAYEIRRVNAVEPLYVKIYKEGSGFVQGKIRLDSTFLSLQKTEFSEEDFVEGVLTIPVLFSDAREESRGILMVSAPYSSCQTDILFNARKRETKGLGICPTRFLMRIWNFVLADVMSRSLRKRK